jgi:putative endonuclease
MHVVYILYSQSSDKYYIGETEDVEARLKQHKGGVFKGSFTTQADDWKVVLTFSCRDREHARKVEQHIKKMKSRKYLENLIQYPEMREKVLTSY